MQQVTITLPPDLVQDLDAAAEERKQDRSEFLQWALTDLLRRPKGTSSEELLAEGYREMAQHSAGMAKDALLVQAAAAEGVWTWDE